MLLTPATVRSEACEEPVARVVSVQGDVEERRAGGSAWVSARLNNVYCAGDMLRVMERSRAAVELSNETVIRLDEKTTIILGRGDEERTSFLDLIIGAVHFISRTPRTLKVATPFVNAGVEGTEFLVRVWEDGAELTVFEGRVLAENEAGSLTLAGGETATVEKGRAPETRVVVRTRNSVEWALYYPPTLYYSPGDFTEGGGGDETGWRAKVLESLGHFSAGDLARAFSAIDGVDAGVRNPGFFTYRASLLLTVGRGDGARADIRHALELQPDNADALALLSVISVVQNDGDTALEAAERAVGSDPGSAAARIAMSYARQYRFDLAGALESLEEAVRLDPESGLAWARLAELRLAHGEIDKALEAAERAAALTPGLARTQTILGFAELARMDTARAKGAFNKAIELDQASGLPRLGMGLAKIRSGELESGRREIEIAASLDPANSLIRSYLGKAYYEEKRDPEAAEELKAARALDPLDPTPLFYGAIRKQSINRQIEALGELEEAIALNDNRAVYRSRLLLDEDLAARSASLARVYSDLGFEGLALVEGWKSLNVDPASHSAHRFLADTYAALPRHEIARVSELLQSQLLQPVSITPVQPRLAESGLLILSGAGPGTASFNEFNPLFNRNRLALQASGIGGGNGTLGDELVFSGVQGRFSFSLGQFHYETDGFRENNDLEEDIYNAFAQASLTHSTSVLVELRSSESEWGDRTLNFVPDDFLPNARETEERESLRGGLHHAFSPGSDLIATIVFQDANIDFDDSDPGGSFALKRDEESFGGELQHLLRSDTFNLTTGAGHYDIDNRETTTTGFLDPFPMSFTDVTEFDVSHTNFYLYSHIKYWKNVTVTIGGSADLFEGTMVEHDQFNPKLGVVWTPGTDTTLRAAAFRVLERTLTTDQTLEPTQVAGFNQFFADAEGTESWRWGLALDQKLAANTWGGLEYSERDLEVPFEQIDFTSEMPVSQIMNADWEERIARAYIYWAPHKWLALSAEYLYERFERDPGFTAGILDLKTHRLPLGINFLHPSGLGARLKTTWIDQDGTFEPQLAFFPVDGVESFWLVDASIDYRLPKRWGLVSAGAKNLFDEEFKYQETDRLNPSVQPERLFFFKFTLAL
jgi:tetratricopeptide (TPR) repeat protein